MIKAANRVRRAVALAAALLLSFGCATKGDLRNLRTEMQRMSARQDSILVALSRQNAVTQDTLRRQTDQLFEMRGDVSRQLQRILDELASLRELTGQSQRTIASVRDQLEGLRRGSAGPVPVGEAESVVGGVEPGAEIWSGAADATYQAALQQYQRGSLATAQRAFEDFVQQYANHLLAPDARFFLADILEQQDRPRNAIDAFAKVPELHPNSPRVADALYRIGLLHLQLGNRQEARRLLERVVNTYPDSDAAGPARAKIREIP